MYFNHFLLFHQQSGIAMTLQENDLSGKICCITGGTSGIGKETALELARMGATIILPARNLELAATVKQEIIDKTGNVNIDIMPCDLVSFDSIRSFAKMFLAKYDRLHILVNNAGIMDPTRQISRDGIERTFAVNHLAPFLLTNLLLETIKQSAPARIVNVSSDGYKSGTINFDDIEWKQQYSGFRVYAQSKLANILFTQKLSSMLIGTGVTVNALHPGMTATNFLNLLPSFVRPLARIFMLTPSQGAETTVYLASSPEVKMMTGKYFIKKKITPLSAKAQSADIAERLWSVSEGYIAQKIQ